MPRNSREVAIGYPHHITQRGNNREPVFVDDEDRWTYLDALNHYTQKYQVDIWAYCLMTNHIHLLAVPHDQNSLARGVGLANMVYTQYLNRKYNRSGRIWQNRFFSSIVDTDEYLWAVARYVESNPVVAGLVTSAEKYEWSSAKCHLLGMDDLLVEQSTWLEPEDLDAYRKFLPKDDKRMTDMIEKATRSGRPI
jgi:putative transposase